jgi:hypothetical protein
VTTPADELRAAAERLRQRAAKVERGLAAAIHEGTRDLFGKAAPDPAAMHPGVGKALADWLESEAEFGTDPGIDPAAITVAHAILGGHQ